MIAMKDLAAKAQERAGEMKDAVSGVAGDLGDTATKTAYAAVGAPVVVGRKIVEMSTKAMKAARSEFDTWAAEGTKVTKQIKDRDMVGDLKDELDQIQGRVGKLREQLEDVLVTWRDNFVPGTEEPQKVAETKPAAKAATTKAASTKSTASKTAAKKSTSTKSAPKTAAKKPAAKKSTSTKSTASKTAAKKPAAKKSTTTKSTASKASAKK